MRRAWIAVIAVLLLLAGAAGLRIRERAVPRGRREKETAVPVRVAPVERRTLREIIPASGTLEADRTVIVSPKIAGRVESIAVDRGDAVARDQTLVRIDPTDYRLKAEEVAESLRVARIDLENAGKTFRRMQNLFAEEVVTRQEMDNVAARRDAAAATVARMEKQLEAARQVVADCAIRSPLSGFVSRRFADEGALAAVGTPILEVVDISRVRVVVPLGERELARVRAGMPTEISMDAIPDERFDGRISRMPAALDAASRTGPVEILVANPSGRLKAGMFVRADIVVRTRPGVLCIPAEAISARMEEETVYTVADGRAKLVRGLRLGLSDGDWIEAVSGISPGDVVAVRGTARLSDGAAVLVEKDRSE